MNARLAGITRKAQDVHVTALGDDILLGLNDLDGFNAVPAQGSFFKFQVFCTPFHLFLQFPYERRVASLQDIEATLDQGPIVFLSDVMDAWCVAVPQVVL